MLIIKKALSKESKRKEKPEATMKGKQKTSKKREIKGVYVCIFPFCVISSFVSAMSYLSSRM